MCCGVSSVDPRRARAVRARKTGPSTGSGPSGHGRSSRCCRWTAACGALAGKGDGRGANGIEAFLLTGAEEVNAGFRIWVQFSGLLWGATGIWFVFLLIFL